MSNIVSVLKNALILQGQVMQILHNNGVTGKNTADLANEILQEVAKSGVAHPIWSSLIIGGNCDCEACADKKDDESGETADADKNEQKFDLGNGVEATVVALQVGPDGVESSVDMNSLPGPVRKMAEEMVQKMRAKMSKDDTSAADKAE